MVQVNKTLLKTAFIMVVIGISLMFGALLHAYAGGNAEHPDATDASLQTKSHPTASNKVQATAASNVKKSVDVCPGDTLSGIASAYLPKGENIHSYINKIKKANGLKNSDLKSGQILVLP